MLVGLELRGVLRAYAGGTPQSPVATKKVPRLWEQDAAGSNPVSPMRSETSPQLVFKPSRKGRFFIAYAQVCAKREQSHLTKILFCARLSGTP